MIDANSQFFAILTNVGMAKQANADALGIPWKLTDMGVGDANGTDPIPSAAQTSLISEWRRRPLNQLKVDPTNSAVIIAEQVIPADEGGKWIREIGLYDADGDLVAVANCAPSFKPVLSQGSGRTQVVRMNFIVSSTGNITLKIDPSVVLATREYVDTKILEELYKLDSKQSVRVATTANIALAGLQVLDGVTLLAGDRVLVKNQTVAKDNGIYIAGAPAWVRAPDADTNAEVTSALLVSVEQGTTLADTRWQLVTDGVIVLGATALTFQNITQGFAPINSPAFLGAPTALTPPQFDSSLRLVNTAFAKRMGVEYSGFAPLTASTALGASSIGGIVAAASATPINITLPPTAGVPDGAVVEVVSAGVGAVTVLAAGLDVLASPLAVVITVVLGAGDNAAFVKVSGTWRLRGGSMALKYAAVMAGPNWITPAQFANDKSFATTEFVRRQGKQYAGFSSFNGNGTIPATSVGQLFILFGGGANTINLPSAVGLPLGATITIDNFNTGSEAITCNGTDVIYGYAVGTVTSIPMLYGDMLELTVVSNTAGAGNGQWYVSGGNMVASLSIPQFDNSTRQASTQHVQRALGSKSGRSTYGATTVLTVADIGKLVMLNFSGSVTLPAVAGLPAGAALELFNWGASPITVNASAGTVMNAGLGGIASFVLLPGTNACLTLENSASWVAKGGDGLLSYSPLFASSLGSPGYQKLPSGDIEMWGLTGSTASGVVTPITFANAFPNACTNIQLTYVDAGTQLPASRGGPSQVGAFSKTGFNYSHSGSGGAAQFFWRAKGN